MQIPKYTEPVLLVEKKKKYRAELLRTKSYGATIIIQSIQVPTLTVVTEVHCICLKAAASAFVALDDNQKQLNFGTFTNSDLKTSV